MNLDRLVHGLNELTEFIWQAKDGNIVAFFNELKGNTVLTVVTDLQAEGIGYDLPGVLVVQTAAPTAIVEGVQFNIVDLLRIIDLPVVLLTEAPKQALIINPSAVKQIVINANTYPRDVVIETSGVAIGPIPVIDEDVEEETEPLELTSQEDNESDLTEEVDEEEEEYVEDEEEVTTVPDYKLSDEELAARIEAAKAAGVDFNNMQ